MTALAVADGASVAWITVIGTLGGAAVTGAVVILTSWLTQRSQGQRTEQEQRFQVERELWNARRDSYVRYGDAVKQVYVQCVKIADNCRGLGHRKEEMDYDRAIADLKQLTDHRTAVWESVRLMGNPETIKAARAWHRSLWQLERFARALRTDADAYQPWLDRIETLRDAFYAAARKDLGITSGNVYSGGPWDDDPDLEPAPTAGTELVVAAEPVQAETPQPGD